MGARANHDVIASKIISTARGDCGLITSAGRLIKISTLDLPTVPATAHAPNLQGGTHVSELITLAADEKVLCLTTLTDDSLGLALGTAQGVVKRVNPEVIGKDSWDVIRLEPGDRVVGAVELTTTEAELVFMTNDAQLLRFPAAAVRAQGRSGGGMAGIKLGLGARVIYFGAVATADAVVATVSGTSRALPGTDAGSVKVTDFRQYPTKGRATGGVRCHRFLKGEDSLLLAWVGPAPPSPPRPAAVPFRCQLSTPGVTGPEPRAVSPSRRSDRPLPAERHDLALEADRPWNTHFPITSWTITRVVRCLR